jgi:crotonobetainyl-CoA:carnitine CoA-transferase CaiB-like acyl-CoA transferase
MSGPLEGVRVLDLTRLLPGPFATQLLLHYGAEVIKVEDTGAGDYARDLKPLPASGFGAAFTASNRGKRSVAIDLKQSSGVAEFLALVDQADVLVESFRPGVMDRLGVGWDVLSGHAPALIYCAITGYGQRTAQSRLAGHDLNYQGQAGLLHRDGSDPVMPTALVGDLVGGSLCAVIAIQAALLERQRTGHGSFVDLSITHSVLMLNALNAAHHLGGGNAAAARARYDGSSPRYRTYQTADARHVTMAALEPKFWDRFCELAGCPDLSSKHSGNHGVDVAVSARLETIFRARTLEEWMQLALDWDVCIGPVLSPEEAVDDALAQGLPLFARFPGPNGEARVLTGAPADLARAAPAPCPPAPRHGEHNVSLVNRRTDAHHGNT